MDYCLDYINDSQRNAVEELVSSNYRVVKTLSCQCYDRAYIVPAEMSSPHFHRGVLTSNKEIVQSSLLFEGFWYNWSHSVDTKSAIQRHSSVIYLGWLEPVWGHILTDCLKKLWFLKTIQCQTLIDEGAKIVALIPWKTKALETVFDLLGVPLSSIENITTLTQFDKVYIPDNSIIRKKNDVRVYTKEYEDTVHELVSKIPKTRPTGKLYFTRSAFSKTPFWERREYGEKVIEKCFLEKGFRIVAPEKLPVLETLTLLKNCEAFASTEGSISHNALFCKEGTPVYIVRKVNYVNTWQLIINQVAKVHVTYIDAHQSIISFGCMGPFYMCVTKELEKFAGHAIFHIPHYVRPSFWWYLVQNRKTTKRVLGLLHLQ